ncbi:DUF1996 domain-containing protein [Streptomyces sp. 7R016]|uniref:DUF1996 domain-containing protein n=2 Tax=Streptomyces spinosisporus TaxID=2927582 RepID=A0ABS9XLT5_9ACTN|nr:DUF1996 domain-containing protein [Streptomyces spinosisporus]MCI3241887.1 DUF1996 domain-containing protein [Streptomyces spinosisporus]
MLGGGGLVAANVYASATEDGSGTDAQTRSAAAATIDCPDVGNKLTEVPEKARGDVDKELATLDQQVAEAYRQLQSATPEQRQDSGYTDENVMKPLKEKRSETLDRIGNAMDQAGQRPDGLDSMADCSMRTWQNGGQDNGQNGDGQGDGQNGDDQNGQNGQDGNGDQQGGNGGQAGNGPVAADFVDITKVAPNVQAKPQNSNNASTGSFTTNCGVNANKNFNSDNVIAAPGVTNGAHHTHDYVGNQKINAFSSNDNFLQGGTSCDNKDDLSSYYWPVVRLQDGTQEFDQNNDGGGKEGNVGKILTPVQAEIKYVGNPTSKVVAMPQFLRIITGDAKTTTNGLANANAHWSCTGFEDKVQLTEQYPLCPQGSKVVRTFAFQSCWDGRNIDSANHRTHDAFVDPKTGACPNGFQAIPQLTERIVYDIPTPTIENGQVKNPYAVDSFPEQLHKPATDHNDFISITTGGLADKIADCINSGRDCGAGGGGDQGSGGDDQGSGGGATEQPSEQPSDQPSDEPTAQPTEDPTTPPAGDDNGNGNAGNDGSGKGNGDNGSGKGDNGGSDDQTAQPPATQTQQPSDDDPTMSSTTDPEVYASAKAKASKSAAAGAEQGGSGNDDDNGDGSVQAQGTGGNGSVVGNQAEPQGGDLAETGTTLWPAAAGTVLLIGGLFLLTRTRRRY